MHQDDFLAVFKDFSDYFTVFIFRDGANGNFDINIFAVRAGKLVFGAVLPTFSFDVTCKTQWQQRPFVRVTFHDHVAAAPAVATIGTAFGNIFFTAKVR